MVVANKMRTISIFDSSSPQSWVFNQAIQANRDVINNRHFGKVEGVARSIQRTKKRPAEVLVDPTLMVQANGAGDALFQICHQFGIPILAISRESVSDTRYDSVVPPENLYIMLGLERE